MSITISENTVRRKLTVNLDQHQINVRPVIKGAMNEASHTLTEAYLSNKSLEFPTHNLTQTKRDDYLTSLFKNMVNSASLQSRDFAVQMDGCKGVLIWSNRTQHFSWPQVANAFKLLGWTSAFKKAFVKLQTVSSDKLRRKIMAHFPHHIIISFVGVLPQEQNKGVGTCLVEYVLDKADEAHHPVYVEATDYQSVKFFERFGFVSQGQITLSKDQMTTLTPMVRMPVALNEPKTLRIRPGRRDSDKSY